MMSIKQFSEAVEDNKPKIKDEVFEVTSDALSGDMVTPNGNDGNFFDIYLDRPLTRVNMPANLREGEVYRFQVRQDMIGGRAIVWGTGHENSGLTCNLVKGSGTSCVLTITAGTFDWSALQSATGRQSFICMQGFAQNPMNINGVKISSFDESAGTITFNHPFFNSVSDVTGDTGISINYSNNFFFQDEQEDSWIGQFPFGVTMFSFYSTTGGASGILKKLGVYSNSMHSISKVRTAEHLTDDFINGSDNGFLEWREANSNGSTAVNPSDVDMNHIGIISQTLNGGETADCRCSTTLGNDMFVISNMRVGIEGVCKLNENSCETADVKYFFGWSDNVQFQACDDGVLFELVADGSVDGYARVLCVVVKDGVRTVHDTGIDIPEDEWFQLHIGIPSNGEKLHFVINDVVVWEVEQTSVGIDEKVTVGFGSYYDYTGTSLPGTKQWFIDAFSLKYRMNSDRI